MKRPKREIVRGELRYNGKAKAIELLRNGKRVGVAIRNPSFWLVFKGEPQIGKEIKVERYSKDALKFAKRIFKPKKR